MKIGMVLYRLLLAVLTAALLLSGSVLLSRGVDTFRQKQVYDSLATQTAQLRKAAAAQPAVSPEAAAPTVPEIRSMLPEYAALYEENPDMVGWMILEGTPIDYPVMQTPAQPDYYLHRSFNGETSAHGCLYARESCDVFTPSDNVTVYGHHMKDGSMFTGLEKYRQASFRNEHPTIRFDTLYDRRTYRVFAVFTTTSTGEGFPYHLFEDAAEEAEFDRFVSTCKSLALYDTGMTPRYGDKLLCLSTCEYSQTNGRLVVAAVLEIQPNP